MSMPLLTLDLFIEFVKELRDQYGITMKEIGDHIGLPPSTMTKIFNQKTYRRDVSYIEAHDMISYILQKMSLVPHDAKTKDYCSKIKLKAAYDDETVSSVAKRMKKSNVSQLPVFSREKDEYLGLVTELSLLNRILKVEQSVTVDQLKEKMNLPESLLDFKSMTIAKANVIEKIPDYPIETSFREIAQLLTHYYAIPLYEKTRVTGIITRADVLKLLT